MMDPHYSAAWAWAGNTPFQWGKQIGSHLGGTRNPMVVHWPARVTDAGGLRSQFTHVTDVAPTILDVRGIPAPDEVDGIAAGAAARRRRSPTRSPTRARPNGTPSSTSRPSATGPCTRTAGGWRCAPSASPGCSPPTRSSRTRRACGTPTTTRSSSTTCRTTSARPTTLPSEHPDKVEELRALFWSEAERYKVLPLLATLSAFFGILPPLPEVATFEFRGDVENVMPGMIPRIYNHSYTISADLVVPEGGAEGVIVAEADHLGGFSLFVDGGRLTHTYSMMGVFVYRQQADEPLPTGEVTVRMEFAADAPKPATGGEVTLYVNDRPVGKGPDGPHGPDPVLRLRGHGHRP